MSRYTIIDRHTLGRRLRDALIISASAIIICGACRAMQYTGAWYSEIWHANTVRVAIENKDYGLAASSLEKFCSEDRMSDADCAKLATELKKATKVEDFYGKLSAYDIPAAKGLLEDMKTNHLLPPDKQADLENMLAALTEESLYETIIGSDRASLSDHCRQYLRIYKDMPHAGNVRTELVLNEIGIFLKDLGSEVSFNESYSQLNKLNEVLSQYRGLGVVIPERIIATAQKADMNMLKGLHALEHNPSIGESVKVRYVEGFAPYSSAFMQERRANFPDGTMGTIIALDNDTIYVKFEGVDARWSTQWSPTRDYWTEGNMNVADFKHQELLRYADLTEVDRERFARALEEMKQLIGSYR